MVCTITPSMATFLTGQRSWASIKLLTTWTYVQHKRAPNTSVSRWLSFHSQTRKALILTAIVFLRLHFTSTNGVWVENKSSWTRHLLKPTQDRNLSQRFFFGYDFPEGEVSVAINNRPEEKPIKMGNMIHDDNAAFLEMTFEAKCADFNTKDFLWLSICSAVQCRERERERESGVVNWYHWLEQITAWLTYHIRTWYSRNNDPTVVHMWKKKGKASKEFLSNGIYT